MLQRSNCIKQPQEIFLAFLSSCLLHLYPVQIAFSTIAFCTCKITLLIKKNAFQPLEESFP
jgi:hypothetical protein